jgi:hypothetical protein
VLRCVIVVSQIVYVVDVVLSPMSRPFGRPGRLARHDYVSRVWMRTEAGKAIGIFRRHVTAYELPVTVLANVSVANGSVRR